MTIHSHVSWLLEQREGAMLTGGCRLRESEGVAPEEPLEGYNTVHRKREEQHAEGVLEIGERCAGSEQVFSSREGEVSLTLRRRRPESECRGGGKRDVSSSNPYHTISPHD